MADGAVPGFSYYTALRLFRLAGEFWREIDGACARQGFDPLDLGVDRFLNLVHSWLMERVSHAEEKDRDAFTQQLFAAPTGVDPDRVTQQVIDEEMSLFHQLARQTSGGGG